MFTSINKVLCLEAVSEILNNREYDLSPAEFILVALKLCLECKNSVFNNQFYLQIDGTAKGLHMFCSYNDIAMYGFDLKALNYCCVGKDSEMMYLCYGTNPWKS